MDIASYLKRQKEQLGAESKQVKDFSVFDFNHVPDQPVMRPETTELIDEMLRFELSGIASHQAVIGSRGSGKTLMLKYLQRVIPSQTDLDVLYANCRQHNTSFKVLGNLLGERTAGASLSDLYERFLGMCKKKTVVVLDEVDLMSPKDLAKDIYKRYCQLSQARQEKPFSYVYFYSNLSYLQSAGLVALMSTKIGRTYANRVLLTFDHVVVDSLYKVRFG